MKKYIVVYESERGEIFEDYFEADSYETAREMGHDIAEDAECGFRYVYPCIRSIDT